MRHDFDLKTNFSYGELNPLEVLYEMGRQGVNLVSITDLFSVEHNTEILEDKNVLNIKYYTGAEWHTSYRMRDIYRVDLIFVDFIMDKDLIGWANRYNKKSRKEIKKLPNDLNYNDSWKNPKHFGKILEMRGLKAAYFRTLWDTQKVVSKFQSYGAKVILKDTPFTNNFRVRLKIIKYLKDNFDIMGMVAFKNEDQYIHTEKELHRNLDICRAAEILPIVGSGVYKNYEKRMVALEICGKSAFSFLTNKIMKKIGE